MKTKSIIAIGVVLLMKSEILSLGLVAVAMGWGVLKLFDAMVKGGYY